MTVPRDEFKVNDPLRVARRRSPRTGWRAAAMAAVLTPAMIAAGCGSSKSPGAAGSGANRTAHASAVTYTRCLRSLGVQDFPDPTPSPDGGACRSILPDGSQPPAGSAQEIAKELKWARCIRSHGLPNFPDPDGQGAFDSSKFSDRTPAFQDAGNACKSLEAAMGSIWAVPGKG